MDYWDRLGWPDTYAERSFTQRQQRYKKALHSRFLGTPQFLVANRSLSPRRLPQAVQRAAQRKPQVAIEATVRFKRGAIAGTVKLRKLDGAWAPGPNVGVLPVLFKRAGTTFCKRGENKGKSIKEFFIVLKALPPLPLKDALAKGVPFRFGVPAGEKPANLGLAVLVEDAAAMKTLECRAFPVSK